MRKLYLYLLTLLCFLPVGQAVAQNMAKFHVAKATEHGNLYFILPHEISLKAQDGVAAHKAMSYDFTYLASQDSVAMLMTLELQSAPRIKGIALGHGAKAFDLEQIYVKRRGKWWSYRLKAQLPLAYWRQAMLQDSPTPFVIYLENGGKVEYAYSPKKWKKRRERYEVFFTTLDLN